MPHCMDAWRDLAAISISRKLLVMLSTNGIIVKTVLVWNSRSSDDGLMSLLDSICLRSSQSMRSVPMANIRTSRPRSASDWLTVLARMSLSPRIRFAWIAAADCGALDVEDAELFSDGEFIFEK